MSIWKNVLFKTKKNTSKRKYISRDRSTKWKLNATKLIEPKRSAKSVSD